LTLSIPDEAYSRNTSLNKISTCLFIVAYDWKQKALNYKILICNSSDHFPF
jgi:hypothetical protein